MSNLRESLLAIKKQFESSLNHPGTYTENEMKLNLSKLKQIIKGNEEYLSDKKEEFEFIKNFRFPPFQDLTFMGEYSQLAYRIDLIIEEID